MQKIGEVTKSLFSQNGVPKNVRFIRDCSGIGAPVGSIYSYKNGFWFGPGEYAFLSFGIRNLIRRGDVEEVKNDKIVCGDWVDNFNGNLSLQCNS